MPYLQILQKYGYQGIFGAFLHAELISAMKTVQNPTIFVKISVQRKMQKNRKMINFGIFC